MAKLEALHHIHVIVVIVRAQVVEQSTPTIDLCNQTATRAVVVRMQLQMLGKFLDTTGQNRDLNFRRANIALVKGKFADGLLFRLFVHVPALVVVWSGRRKEKPYYTSHNALCKQEREEVSRSGALARQRQKTRRSGPSALQGAKDKALGAARPPGGKRQGARGRAPSNQKNVAGDAT